MAADRRDYRNNAAKRLGAPVPLRVQSYEIAADGYAEFVPRAEKDVSRAGRLEGRLLLWKLRRFGEEFTIDPIGMFR